MDLCIPFDLHGLKGTAAFMICTMVCRRIPAAGSGAPPPPPSHFTSWCACIMIAAEGGKEEIRRLMETLSLSTNARKEVVMWESASSPRQPPIGQETQS